MFKVDFPAGLRPDNDIVTFGDSYAQKGVVE
jgi:hypothetical protein